MASFWLPNSAGVWEVDGLLFKGQTYAKFALFGQREFDVHYVAPCKLKAHARPLVSCAKYCVVYGRCAVCCVTLWGKLGYLFFTLYVLQMDQNEFPKRAQNGRFERNLSQAPDSQSGLGRFQVILVKKFGCPNPDFLAFG